MHESEAKVITFSVEEAVRALVEYAKNKGASIVPYGPAEIKINKNEVVCVLYPLTPEQIQSLRVGGSA